MIAEIKDLILGMVFDLGKDKLIKKYGEMKLRKMISDYLDRCFPIISDDIDFEGVISFLRSSSFQNLLMERIDGDAWQRSRARESIRIQAISYSHAEKDNSKKQVGKLIADISDIIQNFFVSQLGHGDHILAARVEDTILTDADEKHKEQMELLKSIDKKQSSSMEQYTELLRNGQIQEAEKILNMFVSAGDSIHPLRNYYKYGTVTLNGENRLFSIPLSEKALELYPPHVIVNGEATVDGKHLSGDKMMKYSYDHQMPICIRIADATAYLGDIRDPSQLMAERYVGKEYYLVPPSLSGVFDCKIMVGEQEFYPNIQMQIVEKKENDDLVFSNRNQDDPDVVFEFEYSKGILKDHQFYIRESNAKRALLFDRFLKAASAPVEISVIDKSKEQVMISWIPKAFTPDAEFGTIDDEIDLLERIVCVEEYYHKQFNYSEISQQEFNYLCYLSEMIRNEQYAGTWKSHSDEIRVSDKLRSFFENTNGEYGFIYGVGEVEDKLFGELISFKFLRIMNHAKMVNFEKKKRQIELADNGETMKLSYVPVDDPGRMIDLPLDLVLEHADPELRDQILKGDGIEVIPSVKNPQITIQ